MITKARTTIGLSLALASSMLLASAPLAASNDRPAQADITVTAKRTDATETKRVAPTLKKNQAMDAIRAELIADLDDHVKAAQDATAKRISTTVADSRS